MSVRKTLHLCVELISCDVGLDSCERGRILPELLPVYRTKIPRAFLTLAATRVLKCPGNASQADDQKTDCGKLTLNEEENLPPCEPQGRGGVSTAVSRCTNYLREMEGP